MIADVDDRVTPPRLADETTALLLAQVGTQAAYRFAEKLFELELLPPHAGVLRVLDTDSGISQRALSKLLCMLPTRVVVLVNELEKRGLVERRQKPGDRRAYGLHLTRGGNQVLASIRRIARIHNEQICEGLSDEDRNQLASLLALVGVRLGLTPGIDAGYRRLVSRSHSRKQGTGTTKLATGS